MADSRAAMKQALLPAGIAAGLYGMALFGAGLHCGATPPAGLLAEAARDPLAVALLVLPVFAGLMALMWQARRFQGRPMLGMAVVMVAFVAPLFASIAIMPGFCALPVSGPMLALGYGALCAAAAGLIAALVPLQD